MYDLEVRGILYPENTDRSTLLRQFRKIIPDYKALYLQTNKIFLANASRTSNLESSQISFEKTEACLLG
jgi:hypothetical protein